MFKSSFRIDAALSPIENLDQFLWDLEQIVEDDLLHDDPQVASAREEIASMAQKLLDSARAFQPIGQITTLLLLDMMIPIEEKTRKNLLDNDIAQRSLQVTLIKEASTRIFQQIKRLQDFIGVVRTLELLGATRVYVEEMIALYLDGRTISIYMIARSALEESLKGKIENRGLSEVILQEMPASSRSGWPDLKALIDFTLTKGIISKPNSKDEAQLLRRWGNDAVHDHYALVASGAEPLAAIKQLSAVLKDISRP